MKKKTKAQKWKSFRDKIAREYIGRYCENRHCGRILEKMSMIKVNHLVRRQHAPDLYFERKNLRITCGCDRDVDYDKRGCHTTNAVRIMKIGHYFGYDSAIWAKQEMEKRGKYFDDDVAASEKTFEYDG